MAILATALPNLLFGRPILYPAHFQVSEELIQAKFPTEFGLDTHINNLFNPFSTHFSSLQPSLIEM